MIQRSQRRGAAAVEFAVCAPLLFLLFFGIVEFGRAMMVLGVVTNAARAGARAGAVTSGDYTAIQTATQTALTNAAITAAPTITVEVNGVAVNSDTTYKSAASGGATISVRVSIPYADVSWLPNGGFFLSDVLMTETAIMRREG